MKTKREVLAWADENGVEIEVETDIEFGTHVHAYCYSGRAFKNEGLHNLSLWDSHAPDWRLIGKTLIDAGVDDCTDPDCEWCDQ